MDLAALVTTHYVPLLFFIDGFFFYWLLGRLRKSAPISPSDAGRCLLPLRGVIFLVRNNGVGMVRRGKWSYQKVKMQYELRCLDVHPVFP